MYTVRENLRCLGYDINRSERHDLHHNFVKFSIGYGNVALFLTKIFALEFYRT